MTSKPKNLDDEYVVVDVSSVILTDDCFTPNCPPRVTQPTFGKFLIRKDGKSDFINQKIEVDPKILEKWADENRGYWVDKPGQNDYYIHELARKYTVKSVAYNPKNTPFKRLFPRPYTCELDCLNERRLTGMKDIENKYLPGVKKITKIEKGILKDDESQKAHKIDPCEREIPEIKKIKEKEQIRWKPLPTLLAAKQRTICQRRDEMNQYELVTGI